MIYGDSLALMKQMPDESVGLVLADPPYNEMDLINASIREARRVSTGVSLYFMYPEDIYWLTEEPDQILHWVKPISTKNTSKRYSRFVEALCVYDLARGPFSQTTHWATRSGVFTDGFVGKQVHPFQKPDSLVEKLLALHGQDLILDPFAGSGTVERVATRLGFPCLSIELDYSWVRSLKE